MTQDEIIEMAREAGFEYWWDSGNESIEVFRMILKRFAKLVAAKEREACAKLCEQSDDEGEGPDCWGWHSKDYAKAIRARGEV